MSRKLKFTFNLYSEVCDKTGQIRGANIDFFCSRCGEEIFLAQVGGKDATEVARNLVQAGVGAGVASVQHERENCKKQSANRRVN